MISCCRISWLLSQTRPRRAEPAGIRAQGSGGVKVDERDVPLSFVGSITSDHGTRYELIDRLVRETDIRVWADWFRCRRALRSCNAIRARPGVATCSACWALEDHHQPAHRHRRELCQQHAAVRGDRDGRLAHHRLEGQYRRPVRAGKEVVCYKSVDECLELIDYYSRHEAERAAIAAAGQRRTLQHHSYAQVVADQVRIFESYLAKKHAGERMGEENLMQRRGLVLAGGTGSRLFDDDA